MLSQEIELFVDGKLVAMNMAPMEPLVRSVLISLFTHRRAEQGDVPEGEDKYGWWGDSFPEVVDDKIGSRLWLLSRETITKEIMFRTEEYAKEALQWLITDGVAASVDVLVERAGVDRINLRTIITRMDGKPLDLRFNDVWSFLNV